MKWQYWYYYSSEEFSAEVIKAPASWNPEHADSDFCGHYEGPFTTVKAARLDVLGKIYNDMDEFKRMLQNVKGRPSLIS
jgi:hypothetical protein